MNHALPTRLLDRLLAAATAWSEANDRTIGALASIVVNHGSFFDRLESPGASTTTATLEKFARFLGDPAQWPDGAVPDVVAGFVHAVGVSPEGATAATGLTGEMSGQVLA